MCDILINRHAIPGNACMFLRMDIEFSNLYKQYRVSFYCQLQLIPVMLYISSKLYEIFPAVRLGGLVIQPQAFIMLLCKGTAYLVLLNLKICSE